MCNQGEVISFIFEKKHCIVMKVTMKHLITITICTFLFTAASAQFIARMEVKEPIPGLCDEKNVLVMFPVKGQEEAKCPVEEDEILKRLNEIQFMKDNPGFSGKGMMGLVINCEGKVVKCKMDGKNKTGNEELDKQIEEVFNSLGEWKPGRLKKKEVDTSRLYSFTIDSGKFSF